MSKRKKIKAEDKVRIAKACANGDVSLNAAAEHLGIHQSVVTLNGTHGDALGEVLLEDQEHDDDVGSLVAFDGGVDLVVTVGVVQVLDLDSDVGVNSVEVSDQLSDGSLIFLA